MLKSIVVIVVVIFVNVSEQCPTIINRAGWGARWANTPNLAIRPAPFVVVHHTDTPQCQNDADCRARMRQMQNWHMDNNRWPDIGYNFCVGNPGIVYEGRGWGRWGAHSIAYNNQSVGLCFIGTFTGSLPTAAALNSAQSLISCGVRLGHIRSAYWVIGHRQDPSNPTTCPGQRLFDHIRSWPNFNANPRPLF